MCGKIIQEQRKLRKIVFGNSFIDVCEECIPTYDSIMQELNRYRGQLEEEFDYKIKEKEKELKQKYVK